MRRPQTGDGVRALVVLDIDRFAAVNATYGRAFADSLLTDIAAILRRAVRPDDVVCRLGGDEFAVFLYETTPSHAQERIAKTVQDISARLQIKTRDGNLSARFGAAMSDDGNDDFESLLTKALEALGAAKAGGSRIVWRNDSGAAARPVQITPIAPLPDAPFRIPAPAGGQDIDALPERIEQALAQIGRAYDISRAYVFELTGDKRFAVNTYEWCARGIAPEIEHLQMLPAAHFLPLHKNLFSEDGVLYCHDIANLPAPIYEILKPQGIKSMLQCVLQADGCMYGMVGFDECRQRRIWNGKQIKALSEFAEKLGTALYAYREKHGCTLEALQAQNRLKKGERT